MMLDRELMDIAPEAPLLGAAPAPAGVAACDAVVCHWTSRALSAWPGRHGSIARLRRARTTRPGHWVCAIGAFRRPPPRPPGAAAPRPRGGPLPGLPPAAVTFSPDPADVLGEPQGRSRLLTCEERSRGLLALGVDAVVAFDLTAALAALDHLSFMGDALLAVLDVGAVVVGSDFRLGAAGAGTVEARRPTAGRWALTSAGSTF